MIELEFRNVDFFGARKTGEPEKKTPEARERINNKLNSHMTSSPGIEPEITLVRGEHLIIDVIRNQSLLILLSSKQNYCVQLQAF
jgi:hypothetical protein